MHIICYYIQVCSSSLANMHARFFIHSILIVVHFVVLVGRCLGVVGGLGRTLTSSDAPLRCPVRSNGVSILGPLLKMLRLGQGEVADEDDAEHDNQEDHHCDHQHPPHVLDPRERILEEFGLEEICKFVESTVPVHRPTPPIEIAVPGFAVDETEPAGRQ